jgi:hypothetical protein
MAPTTGPSTRSSGTEACSTIVTSRPFSRADAPTSAPIQPAPITTTLRPRRSRFGDRVGVVEVAQVEHARQLRAGDGEAPRLGPGGEQQPVIAEAFAALENDL